MKMCFDNIVVDNLNSTVVGYIKKKTLIFRSQSAGCRCSLAAFPRRPHSANTPYAHTAPSQTPATGTALPTVCPTTTAARPVYPMNTTYCTSIRQCIVRVRQLWFCVTRCVACAILIMSKIIINNIIIYY